MLSFKNKESLITKFRLHKKDTGSSQIQIALLTEKIKELTKHLKKHPKDNHSRRGLLKMVARRKKLMEYLKERNPETYETLAKKLKLRK
jgi:small subunit ribosomal protein S15